MKDKKISGILTAIFILLAWSIPSYSEEKTEKDVSYLCIADSAVGFIFNKSTKAWNRTFIQTDRKYIISKSESIYDVWEVNVIGDDFPFSGCKEDFNDDGNLFCEGLSDFRFNKYNLRFLKIYPIGYWNEFRGVMKNYKEGNNTPYMEIGKCSPL